MSLLNSTPKSYKKNIFIALLIALPFIFFFLFEISLRIFNYGQDFSLFIDNNDSELSDYKTINPDFGSKYFHKVKYTKPIPNLILKEKDKSTFRIIVMGSSSVVGFPYDANLMFPRILQNRLEETFPNKRIEVINTAITAVNSFTLLDISDDILAEDPDAILIYAGHNEYYGAFGVGSNEGIGQNRRLKTLHLKLMNLRLYQLLYNAIDVFSSFFHTGDKPQKDGSLMTRIVKNADIPFLSVEYNLGLEQYTKNMSDILEKANNKNIPVFISTLVSNVRDNKPFGSSKSLTGDSAANYYTKAQIAENSGDYKRAKELYEMARDLDCVRFRASSDINIAIEELSKKHNAFLVPMLKFFEDNSPNSIVGNNLLLEHVHPNISGYFLMADAFYNSIINSQIIDENINKSLVTPDSLFRKTYGYTILDSLMGFHMIEILKNYWPFTNNSINRTNHIPYKSKNTIDSLAYLISISDSMQPTYAHLILAKIHTTENDILNAYKEYKAIGEINRFNPELLSQAADFFISIQDLPMALKYLTKVYEQKKSDKTCLKLGNIYMSINDYENAAKCFNESLNYVESISKVEILSKLYQTYTYMGKTDEVNQTQQKIWQYQPSLVIDVPAKVYSFGSFIPYTIRENVNKAYTLFEENKNDQALALLLNCIEINNSPDVNRMIGMIYVQQEDFHNACLYLEKAYSWYKFEPDYLTFMIQIELNNKNKTQARICLEQLKVIDNNNQSIQILEEILSKI
jgi:tetratricopeptide (TPR) repeat protein/lysophospholipase L1-like esterase